MENDFTQMYRVSVSGYEKTHLSLKNKMSEMLQIYIGNMLFIQISLWPCLRLFFTYKLIELTMNMFYF